MLKQTVFQGIVERGMVGIVRADSPEAAVQIAEACIAGGVTALEVAFTTPDTLGVLRTLRERHGHDVLLLGLASRLAWYDLRSGAVTTLHVVEDELPMTRLNDGRCDRQGRFVFGTLDERACRESIGSFYRLNLDLTLERLPLPNVAISNSICFSVDGAAMYFCDSIKGVIWRWDDYLGGDASQVKVFAQLAGDPGAPDGATIDADGYLWSAQWGASRVLRFAPDGSVDRQVTLPVSQPSCVSVGGPDYHDVFITTAQENLTSQQLAAEPQAGGLFHARVDGVRGLAEVRFKGTPV